MSLSTLFGTLLLAGLATTAPAQAPGVTVTSVPGKVLIKGEIEIQAVVTAVDKAKRVITVQSPQGEVQELTAGPEVANFDQIKVGDGIQAKATQSLFLELFKGGAGTPLRMDSDDAAKAQPGAKPFGSSAKRTILMTDVVAVDRKASTITLKGMERSMTLDVKDPAQLKLIEVGDRVRATFDLAVVVAVVPEPAQKK
jgi:Cu/Ag efflux protein CusF